eukprot:TRINITY_DN158_c5_g1_i1.p1 TRINITY_DN158_c5_g1~~TRINITY_DN158_c5_g1_i1.p1  ORF type:complete len:300 (+),score=109.32 TRINITY_DN158_c5_g1_i1:38-937(+)
MDLQLIIVLIIVAVVAVAVFGQLKGSRPSYEVLGVDQLTAHQSKDDKKKEKPEKKVEQFHWDQAEKKEKKADAATGEKKKKKKIVYDPVAAGQSMVVKPTTEEKKGIDVTMVDRKAKARSEKEGFVTVESKSKRSVSKDLEEDEEPADKKVVVEEVEDARVAMLRAIIEGRKPTATDDKDGSPRTGGYKGKNPRKPATTDDNEDEKDGKKDKDGKKVISAIEQAIIDNRKAKDEKKDRFTTSSKKELASLGGKKFAVTSSSAPAPWAKPASPKAVKEAAADDAGADSGADADAGANDSE